jgi:hypothetical protein
MPDTALLDRAHDVIMCRFIETGQAPHYTELARDLGIPIEEGRRLVHDLMVAGVPGWIHPQTDYIASFPPFNNQPTQYRATIQRPAKMVCAMWLRGACHTLGVPQQDGTGRCSMPRLRGTADG